LHKITALYAILIISRQKRPESPDSGRHIFRRKYIPHPLPGKLGRKIDCKYMKIMKLKKKSKPQNTGENVESLWGGKFCGFPHSPCAPPHSSEIKTA
jgi:hypothetical protein